MIPKYKNVILAFKDRLPINKLFYELIIKTHIIGYITKRCHLREDGESKIMYNTRDTALKIAKRMTKKQGKIFCGYKCIWCDGYHIGKL